MKRDEIKNIFENATDEQISKVLNINGADLEKLKNDKLKLEEQIKQKDEAFSKLTSDFNALQENNATAEDYRKKFEDLQKEVEEQKKLEATEKIKQEQLSRYEVIANNKPWKHEAIKESYFQKFIDALTNKNYIGKSDEQIFNELIKDDPEALKNVEVLHLEGSATKSLNEMSRYNSKDDIMKIENWAERQQAIQQNPHLFTKG